MTHFFKLTVCNKLDLDRKLSPFNMKTNGITDINALRPPSKLHAPEIPKRANIGAVASGRTVASKDREQLDAALADAAYDL